MDYEDLHHKVKPDHLKLLRLYDLRRLGYDVTRDLLIRHGFTDFEVNWIIDSEEDEDS